jgi:hypothetical protein
MMMPIFANLHKKDAFAKVIDDCLVAFMAPPLGSEIEFAARSNNPKRHRNLRDLLHL